MSEEYTKLLKKMEELTDFNRQILDRLKDIDEVGDTNKEQILNILNSQTSMMLALEKVSKQSRVSLRKEIKQLQGFMMAASAAAVFFFGWTDTTQRDTILAENSKDLIAVLIAGAGGYKVFRSEKTSEEEEDSIFEKATS